MPVLRFDGLRWRSDVVFDNHDTIQSIAVLGMVAAGKTQFLANIRNIERKVYEPTLFPERYDSFSINLGNREVKIEKGIDISGADEFVRYYYKDLINRSNIVFFLFDSFMYLNKEEYANNVQARLEFIHRHIGNKSIETVVFGTFADKFKDNDAVNNAYSEIKKSMSEKDYGKLFGNNLHLLNMLDKKRLMELLKNILC
jgi:hypothetical protein